MFLYTVAFPSRTRMNKNKLTGEKMDTTVTKYIDQYGVTEQTRSFLTQTHKIYIGGEFCPAEKSEIFDVLEPCTEGVLAQVAAATTFDVDKAVAAAKQAFTYRI